MAVIYISAAGVSGNSGASDLLATTLTKALSIMNPGDILLCKKGDTLSGVFSTTRSGTSGVPIIMDIYGSATTNPIIDGGGSSTTLFNINASFITIKNIIFQNVGNSLITLNSGNHDISFNNNYFTAGRRGINAFQCGAAGILNIIVTNNYFKDINDPGFSQGGGNSVQFNSCSGSGGLISNNYCYTVLTGVDADTAGVGDVLSVFKSNGTIGSNIFVTNNKIRGGGSQLFGKAGVVLGDVGGSYQTATGNICVNSGCSGLLVQGGTFITVSNNKLYSKQTDYTGAGLGLGNYSGVASNNITMSNNIINWTFHTGGIANLDIDTPSSSGDSTTTGLVGGPTLPNPIGWSSNSANTFADPGAFDALLPDPLFIAGVSNIVVIPIISYSSSSNSLVNGITISTIGVTASSYYPITSYSISPALPTGLSFNTTTGAITGTPSILSSLTTYTITANSIGGSGTTSIHIEVILAAGSPVLLYKRIIQL